MRLLYTSALSILSTTFLLHLVVAHTIPDHAIVLASDDPESPPRTQRGRRALVHGLPPGWSAVFETVTSIQPPLISPAFVQLFSAAANLAVADPVPGRHIQRLPFGSLILEFIANGDKDQIVTKEFVAAASLWLLDAAQKGWTGFFKAWVLDKADGELVFVRLGTMWDELMSLSN